MDMIIKKEHADEALDIIRELSALPGNNDLVNKSRDLINRISLDIQEREVLIIKSTVNYLRYFAEGDCPICGTPDGKLCKSPDGSYGAHCGRRRDGWQMARTPPAKTWIKAEAAEGINIRIKC